MPRFAIAPDVFARFPDYIVAGVLVTGLDAATAYPALRERLAAANAECAARVRGGDPKSLPEIAAWRAAFQQLGISASTYQSAVEALARRAAKGHAVPSISPYVDLGNIVSLAHLVPVGAHDAGSWMGDALAVRLAGPEDSFQPAETAAVEHPEVGEIIYATGTQVRTRRWVWRQGWQARVGPDAVSVFYPIDGFERRTGDAVRAAQADLSTLATGCGATVERFMVDRDMPAAAW